MSGAQPFKDRVEVATLDPFHDALAVSDLACMTWRTLQATAIPKNREGAVEALRALTIA